MVAKTRSAQEGVGVGVVEGVVDGVGEGVAADPQAETAATTSERIAASHQRAISRVQYGADSPQAAGKSSFAVTSYEA